ncbi:MAG: cytoplasmic iron level regulating protein YaaA (DUF328/UPF0246 family) [Saprospiraceae bacterium]|jgi:cytoplasmic iron level regulating protein YaaA (DUF328/UPF0246 family)
MIILLSPAKSLNLNPIEYSKNTSPLHKSEIKELISIMKTYDSEGLGDLMHISKKLADENLNRFSNFKSRHTGKNSKQAVFTFDGDVYRGLNAQEWTEEDLTYAQDHLRILSGLYGVLRPLDLIQAYRLEMGSSITTNAGKGLYKYWGSKISKHLNGALRSHGNKTILNLASNEYFKAVDLKTLKSDILNINFKEYRNGKVTFVSFSAKVARGLMANYIMKNRIEDIEEIKGFNVENYRFDMDLSKEGELIFSR